MEKSTMLERMQSALVIGLGRSGQEAALLLHELGLEVTVLDDKKTTAIMRKARLLTGKGIKVKLGSSSNLMLRQWDLVIASPGVRPSNPLLQKASSLDIPVWSELELGSRFVRPDGICAITGTNGKTTTTLLTHRMLSAEMPLVEFGGNIGIPLSRLVRQNAGHFLHGPVVLEVSSFQLEFTKTFQPHTYAVLNVSVDHLDWHPSFDAYVQAKTFPLERMGPQDVAFLNFDDSSVRQMTKSTNAKIVYFSEKMKLPFGLYMDGTQLIAHLDKTYTIDTDNFGVTRFHSWQNVLCAVGIALSLGVSTEKITQVLRTYHPLRHRQEVVAVVDGVVFVDDSKATNLDAVRQLLGTIENRAILIMGGKDKGGDFSALAPVLTGKIHHIIAIGQARQRIAQELGGAVETLMCATLPDAVQIAFHLARPGDTVALSPGCSSFDQFTSYRHRGRVFRHHVLHLRVGNETTKVL